MRLLGIDIKHPSVSDMVLLVGIILAFTIGCIALYLYGAVQEKDVFPLVAVTSAGVISSVFGVSVGKHGLKALGIALLISAIIFFLMRWAGVI